MLFIGAHFFILAKRWIVTGAQSFAKISHVSSFGSLHQEFSMPRLLTIHVILFDGYEPLDAFGPVEVLGDHARLRYFSAAGGLVGCRQDVKIQTEPFSQWTAPDAVLIPGGQGTRPLSKDS